MIRTLALAALVSLPFHAAAQERPRAPAAAPATPIPPRGGPAEKQAWLRGRVDAALAAPELRGARVGIAMAEVDSGRVLYSRDERLAFNPASGTKLVTTIAALALLGPEYRWKTVFYAAGPPEGGVVHGDLYVRGFGDPTLSSQDLWHLVAQLGAAGVRRVTGGVVIDDTFFDEQRLAPAYDQKDEDLPFRAATSAVSLNYNAVGVTVWPTSEGAPPRVVLDPPSDYVKVVVRARTSRRPGGNVVVRSQPVGENTVVTVSGRISVGAAPRTLFRRIEHPSLFLGFSLRDLLQKRGIKLEQPGVRRGAVPVSARPVAEHVSEALSVIIRTVNKRSNNMMSEQILKTIGAETGGAPGSFAKGIAAVQRFLAGLGLDGGYQYRNGSGLYDANRFSAQQMVAVLRYAYRDFRVQSDFVASLAVAGADGTVSHRLHGRPSERWVRAKTGSLAGVSSLQGYAGAPAYPPVAFAVLMNDIPEGAEGTARRAQDEIADALVTFLHHARD